MEPAEARLAVLLEMLSSVLWKYQATLGMPASGSQGKGALTTDADGTFLGSFV